MIYIRTIGNKTYTYNVSIDNRKLMEELLSTIVINTSYTTSYKEQKLECDPQMCFIVEEIERKLPDNQTPMYTDVEAIDKVIIVPSNISDDKIRPYGQPVIKAKKTIVPELAYIVRDLLDNKDAIERFIEYETSEELIDIDEKINYAHDTLDVANWGNICDFKAIQRIYNKSYILQKMKDKGEVFNSELLKKLYYSIASICSVQLIKIAIKNISTDVCGPIIPLQSLLQETDSNYIKIKDSK